MKHALRSSGIFLVVLLLSLTVVGTAYAQDNVGEVAGPFASILAGAVSVERLLELVRRIVSPDPEKGLLARGSPALQYYATVGGVVLGLLIAFASGYRLLESAGISLAPAIDRILTGVVIGLGSELAHEVIKAIGEAKHALRTVAKPGTQ